MESEWEVRLAEEFKKPYYQKIESAINEAYSSKHVFPEKREVFNAFKFCGFNELKVVIIGQDPYPTAGHANGLCFSVNDDVAPLPKSLQNIFKEIASDLNIALPKNGNLERWAKQGVLLLNTVLTVEEGTPDSHSKIGWQKFTDKVLEIINEEKEHVVFLLWGKKAQDKGKLIDEKKHLVLKSVHPSPLSVYRGFYGCKHFSKTNSYLVENGEKEIVW